MATRSFRDPEEREWMVWDVVPGEHLGEGGEPGPFLPDEMAQGWLCFESGTEKRRLYPVPGRWPEFSDEELWALCRAGEPVARVRASVA